MVTRAGLASLVMQVIGCGTQASYPQVAADDPSILLDRPFRGNGAGVHTNGWAYDRAECDLTGIDLVLIAKPQHPGEVEINRDGPAGRLELVLEKRWFDGRHVSFSSSIRKERKQLHSRTAKIGAALAFWVDRGSGGFEHGMSVRLQYRVPPGTRLEWREDHPEADKVAPSEWAPLPQTPHPVPANKQPWK